MNRDSLIVCLLAIEEASKVIIELAANNSREQAGNVSRILGDVLTVLAESHCITWPVSSKTISKACDNSAVQLKVITERLRAKQSACNESGDYRFAFGSKAFLAERDLLMKVVK